VCAALHKPPNSPSLPSPASSRTIVHFTGSTTSTRPARGFTDRIRDDDLVDTIFGDVADACDLSTEHVEDEKRSGHHERQEQRDTELVALFRLSFRAVRATSDPRLPASSPRAH